MNCRCASERGQLSPKRAPASPGRGFLGFRVAAATLLIGALSLIATLHQIMNV